MKKRLILSVLVFAMILGMSSTAFAAGETLSHSATSRYWYVSTNYVPQKSDNHLDCTYGITDPIYSNMVCRAVIYDGGWQTVSTTAECFETGTGLTIPDSTSGVRQVHVKIENYGSDYGNPVYTLGHWVLNQ